VNPWKISDEVERLRQRRRAEVTSLLLNPKHTDTVLEVGCGGGYITSFFAPRVAYTVCLDISLEALKIARSKLDASNISFILGNATKLPFRSSCFDKVVVPEVLEHLTDPKLCTNEVGRCNKERGLVIISVPYKEKISYTRCLHCKKLTPLWGHLHSFNEQDIISLLPNNYTLISKKHLPNVFSLSRIFRNLPFKVWLMLNDLLGKLGKGYWIVYKFHRNQNIS